MTREEIIKMAQSCSLVGIEPQNNSIYIKALEHFATLVAEKEQARCIDILERLQEKAGDRHNYYACAVRIIKEQS